MSPIDYLQVKKQAGAFATSARNRLASLKEKTRLALELLHREGADLETFKKLVQTALTSDPGLRCALPVSERLDTAHKTTSVANKVSIAAADGSQINPSHHEAYEFALLNMGAIVFIPGKAAQETVRTTLLGPDDITSKSGYLTEEMLALQRDVRERRLLLELAKELPIPVAALTDGTLEIYGEPKQDPDFERQFVEYLAALREMASLELIVAGYVDQPRADLAVRLLELRLAANKKEDLFSETRPLAGLTDASLFRELLQPGDRSAVFAIQSRSAKKFTAEIGLHFFYLNVGRPARPQLARVELPAWVAQDPEKVDLLHSILKDQCRIMGANPYPYVLHRAHEIAVVHQDEKEAVLAMLTAAYLGQNLELGHTSGKQSAKDLQGRTRYTK